MNPSTVAPACRRSPTGLERVRLFLFLSLGSSLADWQRGGTLDRETALYRALLPRLAGVEVISYGRSDQSLLAGLGGISLSQNPLGLPLGLYRRLLARGLHLKGRGPAVVKSNQMQGAEVALQAARSAGHPFLARCGYLPSNIAVWRAGADSPEAQAWFRYEARVFSKADRVAVTTPAMAATVKHRYGVDPARVRVVPNFVDTERFSPAGPESPRPDRVLYVGRLHPEKNLRALLLAMEGLPAELHLVGEGPQRAELEALAAERKLAVRFLGQVANADLPGLIRQATVFVLPSRGEHHPKSLIEAMACGATVVGSNAPGIRELIDPGRTGLLCGLAAADLHAALAQALADPALRHSLGAAARQFTTQHFAFDHVLSLELDLLAELAG